MRIKQLESLRSQHKRNLELKQVHEPELSKAIALAIISGEPLRIKSAKEIIASARKNIANCACRYGSSERSLYFSDIFDFRSDELAQYQKDKKKRDAMLSAYTKKADRILARAELDDTMEATDASELLAQAARDAGLID